MRHRDARVLHDVRDELVGAQAHARNEVDRQGIPVLVEESFGVVLDLSGVVVDSEARLGALGLGVALLGEVLQLGRDARLPSRLLPEFARENLGVVVSNFVSRS